VARALPRVTAASPDPSSPVSHLRPSVHRGEPTSATEEPDFVDFDGFKNGVLLEVKGPGYKALLEKMYGQEWFRGAKDMFDQAQRQIRAAKGTPIRWHFAEKEVADFMRGQFQKKNLGQIEILP
jgi:hypothetical protein